MSASNGGHNPARPALSPEQVTAAVEAYREGRTAKQLGEELGVTPSAITYHVHKAGLPLQQPHRKPSEVRATAARAMRSARSLGSEAPPADVVLAVAAFADRPDWQADGLCAETDPDSFYPEKGGSSRAAKAVCGRCPVRQECLEYALANNERFGIWGGLSERERHSLRRRLTA